MTELNGAKFFTIFDAKKGYLHVPLDEQSSYLTTFSTPFGRYHFKCLLLILALLFPKTCFKNGSTQHLKAAMASPVSLTTHLYMDHPTLSTTETLPNSWKQQKKGAVFNKDKVRFTSKKVVLVFVPPGRHKESNLITRKYQRS